MNITEANLSGGCHVVILGAGASVASALRNPEAHGFRLPSMKDLPEVVGLNGILNHFTAEVIPNNFEATYSNIAAKYPDSPYLKTMNDMIYSYFSSMKLPDNPTIYDYLVMSLRDKDVIATFNWDPFLQHALWRNISHGSSPQLLFLHGNVAVGYNEAANMTGLANWTSPRSGNYYKPTQLLFPVKHKDYSSNVFIRKQWEMLKARLTKKECNTHNVTIFGYSAPVTDVEAMSMMKDAWGDIYDRNLEQFEFIDIREKDDVVKSWSEFVHTYHYDYANDFFDSNLAKFPRRTDEAWWCHYMPITPEEAFADANPIPRDFQTFEEMWAWYQPLIDKENEQ